MIILVAAMGTVIVGLVQLNLNTRKKLRQEEEQHMFVMEEYFKVVVKYFYATNNVEGLRKVEQRGLNLERLKNKEIEIKVIEK